MNFQNGLDIQYKFWETYSEFNVNFVYIIDNKDTFFFLNTVKMTLNHAYNEQTENQYKNTAGIS